MSDVIGMIVLSMIRMMQRDESDVGNTHDFKNPVPRRSNVPFECAVLRLVDDSSCKALLLRRGKHVQ